MLSGTLNKTTVWRFTPSTIPTVPRLNIRRLSGTCETSGVARSIEVPCVRVQPIEPHSVVEPKEPVWNLWNQWRVEPKKPVWNLWNHCVFDPKGTCLELWNQWPRWTQETCLEPVEPVAWFLFVKGIPGKNTSPPIPNMVRRNGALSAT